MRIKVIGLGGGGSNAVDRMMQIGIPGVEFITANTDAQALQDSDAPCRIQLGVRSTRGLGAGGDPSVGARAAEENFEEARDALAGADMVFIAAGMGGGTGTGSAPVIAEVAKSLGALTVGVVTEPFSFEGKRRREVAKAGILSLREVVDTLLVIPNDRLMDVVSKSVSLDIAFRIADDVLRQGIQGVSELVTKPGLINVDFSDIQSVMRLRGSALMSIGQGRGDSKAVDAAEMAVRSPLLDIGSISGAAGILANITGGPDLSLVEVGKAVDRITHAARDDANIIFGTTLEPAMEGRAQVILVATGIAAQAATAAQPMRPRVQAGRPAGRRGLAAQKGETVPIKRVAASSPAPAELPNWQDDDPLEIPAFLRRRRVRETVAATAAPVRQAVGSW